MATVTDADCQKELKTSNSWLFGCLVVWWFGCLVVWLFGCLVVWLSGHLVVWSSGHLVVSTYRHIAYHSLIHFYVTTQHPLRSSGFVIPMYII